ncbi:M48 family metalloprotease [Thiocapsa imhoffii]|uniref:M48 family metalloprotease n=1 Tax=Thiocapsa imhoffii TaxID=382777 RepID=UPI0030B91828
MDVRGFGRTREISYPWKCKLTEGSERCSKILPKFTLDQARARRYPDVRNPAGASAHDAAHTLGVSRAYRIGRDLMAQAGFDPRASVLLWRNMAAAGGSQPPAFLSTHPAHNTRMEQLAAGLEQAVEIHRQARAAGRMPVCLPP